MAGNNKTTAGGLQGNCGLLLLCLVCLLVAYPFLEDVTTPLMLSLPVAGVFVAGVVAADAERHHIRIAFALGAVQVSLTAVTLIQRAGIPWTVAVILALLTAAILMLFSAWCVLNYVLHARVITRDQIYAGICLYIMLGFAFGALYYLINTLDPKSFVTSVKVARGDTPDLMYFSFVTLATLGYGDIVPRTNVVRSLAVLEAMVGMIYIAVFMARLVSMRSNTAGPE